MRLGFLGAMVGGGVVEDGAGAAQDALPLERVAGDLLDLEAVLELALDARRRPALSVFAAPELLVAELVVDAADP